MREALRFQTAEWFERGDDIGEIARELSVTRKSVNEWKRAGRAGGAEAMASKGPTPTVNPVEGVWSTLKGSLGNLALHSTDALAALVRSRLRVMQDRRDGLLDGFIAETGLGLEPP